MFTSVPQVTGNLARKYGQIDRTKVHEVLHRFTQSREYLLRKKNLRLLWHLPL